MKRFACLTFLVLTGCSHPGVTISYSANGPTEAKIIYPDRDRIDNKQETSQTINELEAILKSLKDFREQVKKNNPDPPNNDTSVFIF